MANHSTEVDVPTHKDLFNPVLKAIHGLGGSASNTEIVDRVIEDMRLSDTVIEVPHKSGRMSRLEYRIGWAKSFLKKYDLIDNSERGIWSLTNQGRSTQYVDPDTVSRYVAAASRPQKSLDTVPTTPSEDVDDVANDSSDRLATWRDELLEILLKMDPTAFERLCQRILRESDFIEVNVTQQSGDGGIDGNGIIRLGGLISFPVAFQCKRYSGSVSSPLEIFVER